MRFQNILAIGTLSEKEWDAAAARAGCTISYTPTLELALTLLRSGVSFDLTCVCLPAGTPRELADAFGGQRTGLLAFVLDLPRFAAHSKELTPQDACEILPAPLTELAFEALLRRSERLFALLSEIQHSRRNTSQPMEELIGRSDAWLRIRKEQAAMAASGAHVLITGDVGTGKRSVARAIHRQSLRADGPLIFMDCTLWPDHLLETELIGSSQPGGRVPFRRRSGSIELARGGTLVISHIERASLAVQDKLLETLQHQSNVEKESVRLVCISSSLTESVDRDGNFRAPLLALLSPLRLPTLQERGGDALMLAEYFLRQMPDPYSRPRLVLDLQAKEALINYAWPGNVHELKNAIERAVISSREPVLTAALLGLAPHAASGAPAVMPAPVLSHPPVLIFPTVHPTTSSSDVTFRVGQPMHEVESKMIQRTMELTHGNRTKAAGILGISVRTLYSKLLEIEQRQKTMTKSNTSSGGSTMDFVQVSEQPNMAGV